jgi:hypothetical protein
METLAIDTDLFNEILAELKALSNLLEKKNSREEAILKENEYLKRDCREGMRKCENNSSSWRAEKRATSIFD